LYYLLQGYTKYWSGRIVHDLNPTLTLDWDNFRLEPSPKPNQI